MLILRAGHVCWSQVVEWVVSVIRWLRGGPVRNGLCFGKVVVMGRNIKAVAVAGVAAACADSTASTSLDKSCQFHQGRNGVRPRVEVRRTVGAPLLQ